MFMFFNDISHPTSLFSQGDFGRKAASLLSASVDPRKDLVRQQKSRFESVLELERSAKRMRRLHELEQMDAAQEQMEELKKMKARGCWWSNVQQMDEFLKVRCCFITMPHVIITDVGTLFS